MREIMAGIMEAPFHGMAVLEITWETTGRWWHVINIEAKPQTWFGFNKQNKLVFKGKNFAEAQPLPEGKFILARHFPTYKNPYGLRLLSRCLWPVAFKKGGLTFYTRFLEKYGNPWAVGYAPSGSTKEQIDQMVININRMVRDATAVLPSGAKLELVTVPAGQGEHHEAYIKRMDASIAKVLVGNTLTSEVGDRGSYAASKTHDNVSDIFAESDQDMVITGMNDLAYYYGRLNAGPGEMSPQFDYEEPEDLEKLADLGNKLRTMGARFKPKYFKNRFSLAEDEFDVTEDSGGLGGNFNFSEPSGKTGPDNDFHEAIEAAVKQYAPTDLDFIRQVEKIVLEAVSFEDLERSLAEFMSNKQPGPDAFEDLLADLMVNANLMGRFAEAQKRAAGDEQN